MLIRFNQTIAVVKKAPFKDQIKRAAFIAASTVYKIVVRVPLIAVKRLAERDNLFNTTKK